MVLLEELRDKTKAYKYLEEAINIKPDDHGTWYNMGNVYNALKHYDKAISAYKKAVEIKPDYYEAWCNMGNVYICLDNFPKTLKVFKQYLHLCKQREIFHKDMNNIFFKSFYNKLHVSFKMKEKSQYFTFFKESIEMIKAHSEIDYFQVIGNFYTLLLNDSEFSFFNDCFEEVKTVLGEDAYNSLSFYKTAACYLENKDISILEKLNLEERKPVDLILKEIEKKN